MIRDQLHRDILNRLDARLDDSIFELCAADLLKEVYPTLVPVTGGKDSGFDGAVGTNDGPFPLISTTSRDVLGNVRRNITSYLGKAQGPRRAIVATTRSLTPLRRQHIIEAGRELNTKIINIHDRDDFANRLYRSCKWRLELLGLTGAPPALSYLPPRARTDIPTKLIGRDGELAKLQKYESDLLLVGQPGCGKTFLHQQLAKNGECLFVVSNDQTQLADAIRAAQPKCIVIDDAHTCLSDIVMLRWLRTELGASFVIHANCWPRFEVNCREQMLIGTDDVVHLSRLTRPQILEMIKESGIGGPPDLLDLLLEQADGKPGLAAVLIGVCKRGEVGRFWSGEALADYLVANRLVVRDERDRSILAAFALGGDDGLAMQVVADELGITQLDVREAVTNLAAGGVIEEVGGESLAVWPERLRPSLVKEVFFGGSASLPSDGLLKVIGPKVSTAHVLIAALELGGDVPIEIITDLVERSRDNSVWEHFAYTGRESAEWILEHHADEVCAAAPGLLKHAPEKTIVALLAQLSKDCPRRANGQGDVKSCISAWLAGAHPPDPKHIVRRRLLLSVVDRFMNGRSASEQSGLGWVLAEVIRPDVEWHRFEPGDSRTVRIRRAVYPVDELHEVATLWPGILNIIKRIPRCELKPLLQLLERWCIPIQMQRDRPLSSELCNLLKSYGARWVSDLVNELDSWAISSWASNLSRMAELGLHVDTDPAFESMFADREFNERWDDAFKRRERELKKLGGRLAERSRTEAYSFLARAENEVAEIGVPRGRWHREVLYNEIASGEPDPSWWVRQMVDGNFNEDCLRPFIERLLVEDRVSACEELRKLIDDPRYWYLAIKLILSLALPETDLCDRAVKRIEENCIQEIYPLVYLAMPIETRRKLLQCSNPTTRAIAAIAEWKREPEGEIPSSLKDLWHLAVIEATTEDTHHLGEILATDMELKISWIKARLEKCDRVDISECSPMISSMCEDVSRDQRRNFLRLITPRSFDDSCFDAFVGDDLILFREWLGEQEGEYLRLRPLDRGPSAKWVRYAEVALDEGIDEERLAELCSPRVCELGSDWYKETRRKYENLLEHPDERMHLVAERGIERMTIELDRVLKYERDIEVYGVREARRRRNQAGCTR